MVPRIQTTVRFPRNAPKRLAAATVRKVITSERVVTVEANLRVWNGPTLTAFVQKDHPQKIMLLRIVN
jgi:hypothetical protein